MFDDAQLESLPIHEKLRLVTALWDQIATSDRPLCIPADVLDEADRRIEEMVNDPSAAITEEDMWRRADGLR